MLYCFFTSSIANILLLTDIKEHSTRQDTFSTLTTNTIIQDRIMYLKYRLTDQLHMNITNGIDQIRIQYNLTFST